MSTLQLDVVITVWLGIPKLIITTLHWVTRPRKQERRLGRDSAYKFNYHTGLVAYICMNQPAFQIPFRAFHYTE